MYVYLIIKPQNIETDRITRRNGKKFTITIGNCSTSLSQTEKRLRL